MTRMFYRVAIARLLVAACCVFLLSQGVQAQPITTDSRIKTFVYNPNEVFTITTHYGYQSNIEFGPKERIETISVGDRIGWQIIPSGRRLFIRAMEENAHTNMTIVTNQRAYQFDLRSSSADAVYGSEELTYVVRFFYPTDPDGEMQSYGRPVAPLMPPAALSAAMAQPVAAPIAAPAPAPAPVPQKSTPAPKPVAKAVPAPATAFNYRYTYSGPNDIAPTKIYDDGKSTYFKIPPNQNPAVAIVTSRGESIDLTTRRTTDGLLAVDAIAPQFNLSQSGRRITVYNEAGGEVR